MTDLSSIGRYIRKYRVAAGMSQDKLAELAGISSKHIGVLERGERYPSLESLINIANALDISADMLLCDILNSEVGIKQNLIGKKLDGLSKKDQLKILAVIDLLIEQANDK